MDYKYACVIDAQNRYKDIVLLLFADNTEDQKEGQIQNYTLLDGESLVETVKPVIRRYAGAAGFVRPKWDADTSAWIEAATEEEITAWEVEHPAPERPEPAPTVEELQAKIAALTTSNQMLEDCLVEMAGVIYA